MPGLLNELGLYSKTRNMLKCKCYDTAFKLKVAQNKSKEAAAILQVYTDSSGIMRVVNFTVYH